MANKKINPKAKSIKLKANSKKLFFLIHGYTGSPTDFHNLPYLLNQKLKANVIVPLLPGHGTTIEDLDTLDFEDFLESVETKLKKELENGMQVVLGGISFGAFLALYLASKYPVKGVFNVSIPYDFKFPFNFPGFDALGNFKKSWRKRLGETERKLRKNTFHYSHMHVNGLPISFYAKQKVKGVLKQIYGPCLTIHSKSEPLGDYKSAYKINKEISSKIKKIIIFKHESHNLFFTPQHGEVEEAILNFFKSGDVFNKNYSSINKEKIAALIPSYNEGARISNVLDVLTKTKILDEIIVVDDGSTDNTSEIMKKFPTIKYLKNQKNEGKAYSMDKGVKSTDASIIFFCDADLNNLTPQIVTEIITPVIKNEFDMFIGARGNVMQKTVKKWAINSGERALRREIWEKLPKYYKHRYRIEAGLNNFVKFFGRGFDYKVFNHSQTLKEKKYGFAKGTFLRWWMNLDVIAAVIRFHFYDRFRKL